VQARRSSNRSAAYVALAALAAGCHGGPPDFRTVRAWPAEERRPDGVVVDPPPAPMGGVRRESTLSSTPVALAPPLGLDGAVDALRELLQSVVREDAAAMAELVTERAMFINPASGRNQTALLPLFRERFRKLDYHQLAGQTLLRENEVEVYRFHDLASPLPGRPARPPEMQEDDVLLRARVLVPRMGADRLFGDELLVLVRPAKGKYRIALLLEEFQLP
jgi:hypothetical protein